MFTRSAGRQSQHSTLTAADGSWIFPGLVTPTATMTSTSNHPQRALLAVLHADIVEFSRLVHQDEAAIYRTLQQHLAIARSIISDNEGRLIDTAGDSLLAVFPTVSAAATAAMAMQQQWATANAELPEERRVRVRIGINLGEVIDDGQRVVGDGVNVAARLQEIAPPGGICLSESARAVVGHDLALQFQPIGEQNLRNIELPVAAHLLLSGSEVPAKTHAGTVGSRLSVAVLPFSALDSGARADGLGEALTVELVGALSRFRQLFVLAQHTSLAQQGLLQDKAALGRRLGARYLVDGSIRCQGEAFRISVQLVESAAGGYLWSETYAGASRDLFAIQDEITQRIVSTLVSNIEHSALRAPAGPSAGANYTDVIRARHLVYRMREAADTHQARQLFERVLAADTTFAPALSGLALAHMTDLLMSWSDDPQACVPQATRYAEQALELDPTDSLAHAMFGITSLWRRRYVEAMTHLDRAIELNPNHADAFAGKGLALIFTGQSEAGVQQFTQALERNPFPPSWYLWALAIAQYNIGHYRQAVHTLLRISAPNRFHRRVLAASYARLGNDDNAREQRDLVMAETPGYTAADSWRTQPYADPGDIQPFIDGLVLAGFPPGETSR